MTLEEWNAKGKELFGDNMMNWKFRCPLCGIIISTQDYKDAGAEQTAVAFNCIGRYTNDAKKAMFTSKLKGNGPCDYSGGGLFKLNPLEVVIDGTSHYFFEFA